MKVKMWHFGRSVLMGGCSGPTYPGIITNHLESHLRHSPSFRNSEDTETEIDEQIQPEA